jgi:hypothetical protein
VDTREADNRAFAEKELKGFSVEVTPLGQVPYAIKSMEKTRLGHLEVRIHVCVCIRSYVHIHQALKTQALNAKR